MEQDCIARGCKYQEDEEIKVKSCEQGRCNKLNVYDWLKSVPESSLTQDIVEIRFKNTRKGFYKNVNKLMLKPGDIVAVEASPGHDIGIVSLTGELVLEKLVIHDVDIVNAEFKKVYRKAKQVDFEKWYNAISMEHSAMIKSRNISIDLKLNMKIGDVEYQGDKTKAIFYYIADDRVDFRELIKILADEFKVRIEMKQIGARQEAGRIGGIGSCGRELCCSSWITDFVSVTTNAARMQEVSLNPQKLAGQCGKLKCCLNYELPCYMDAQKDFPDKNIKLVTKEGQAYHTKTDVYRRMMWYAFDGESSGNIYILPVEKVIEIIDMNKKGKKPDKLSDHTFYAGFDDIEYKNGVDEESLNRFKEDEADTKKSKKRKKPQQHHRNKNKKRHSHKPQRR